MKKLLFSIVALFTLVACEKGEIGSKTAPMTVEITIANGSSATKAVTSPATSGAFVCEANDLTAVFADANGIIIKSVAFEKATASNGKYTFTGLTTEVSKVAVIALRDNNLNDITTLAYIHKYTVQEWEQLNYGKDIPVPYQILEENTEEIFALIYPGDVNYDLENEKSVKRYEEMIKDLQEENFTFELNN